jgi:beta-phosphoglucomutase-like phosphatase (HAD superfamily)
MIKALLLDLGGTLEVDDRVLPGAAEALNVIEELQIADGVPLVTCLVSDFKMPAPRTVQAIEATFNEYLEILERLDLRRFFEPVAERITLSTHAGALKPARLVFETALKRAKLDASIEDALFITENSAHVQACRKLKMTVLQFGTDFHDWTDAPLLIAHVVDPLNDNNLYVTLKPLLAAHHDMQLDSVHGFPTGAVKGRGRSWIKLDAPSLGDLRDVHVELPVEFEAKIDPNGRLGNVQVFPPSSEYLSEAVDNVRALIANGQVEGHPTGTGDSPVLPTHSVETGPDGRRYLRRRRFT